GNGNINAVRARPFGDEGEGLLLIALPIAAVNKDEERRVSRPAGEVVKTRPWPRAIGDVELEAACGANSSASLAPACQPVRTVYDCGTVVVGGIERRAIHSAVDGAHANAPSRARAHAPARGDWLGGVPHRAVPR